MRHLFLFLFVLALLQPSLHAEGLVLGRDNFSAVRAVKTVIPIGTPLEAALNQLASFGFTCRRSDLPDPRNGMIAYDCVFYFGTMPQQRRFIVLVTDGQTVHDFQAVLEMPIPRRKPPNDNIHNA
jgi:hypothetical protein